MRNARWQWLGALGVVVVLLVGCGSSDAAAGGDGDDVVAADDESTETSTVDTTDAEAAEEEPPDEPAEGDDAPMSMKDPAAPIAVGSVYEADAIPNLEWGAPFEPGTYRTGALGTPISFTTTETLSTQPNGDGMFVITDIASRAPDDRDLVFLRVGNFSDPAAPNAPIEEQTFWPSDGFPGWLDNLHESVIATDPVETSVNGLPAIRVDLSISDDIECGWIPGQCVGLVENNGHDIKALNKGSSYRVWIVEQGNEDPLAIVAGIARDEDAAWFERSDAVMETVAFGDIAPNPAQWLEPGPSQLNVFGGVEVDLPDNLAELTNGRPRLLNRWNGRGYSFIPVTDAPGLISFAEQPHDMEGNPLGSTDDLVDVLAAAGAELTELEEITIDGVATRVFDVTTTDVGAIMLRFSMLDTSLPHLGWDAPAAGRIWLIEHPDRGLMMMSTHAFENVETMLPQVTELGEAIVGSMQFIDLG